MTPYALVTFVAARTGPECARADSDDRGHVEQRHEAIVKFAYRLLACARGVSDRNVTLTTCWLDFLVDRIMKVEDTDDAPTSPPPPLP
jgi:hypothetical protein